MKAKHGWSVVLRGKNKGKVYRRDCPETTDAPVFDTEREAEVWVSLDAFRDCDLFLKADQDCLDDWDSRIKVN